MTVALPLVRIAGEDLKVQGHMQPADDPTSQRDDVIDFVSNACSSSQSRGRFVDVSNGCLIGPFRRGIEFGCETPCHDSVYSTWICLGPTAVVLAMLFTVRGIPSAPALAFVLAVAVVPLGIGIWMGLFPCDIAGVGAWAARIRESIGALASYGEVRLRLVFEACATRFESGRAQLRLLFTFSNERRLSETRLARLADVLDAECSTCRPCSCHASHRIEVVSALFHRAMSASLRGGLWLARLLMRGPVRLPVRQTLLSVSRSVAAIALLVSSLAFSVRHLAVSMCLSMMRRTSSAIEIPSRLASRFKYVLCGSVNEIICLVKSSVLVSGRFTSSLFLVILAAVSALIFGSAHSTAAFAPRSNNGVLWRKHVAVLAGLFQRKRLTTVGNFLRDVWSHPRSSLGGYFGLSFSTDGSASVPFGYGLRDACFLATGGPLPVLDRSATLAYPWDSAFGRSDLNSSHTGWYDDGSHVRSTQDGQSPCIPVRRDALTTDANLVLPWKSEFGFIFVNAYVVTAPHMEPQEHPSKTADMTLNLPAYLSQDTALTKARPENTPANGISKRGLVQAVSIPQGIQWSPCAS